MISEILYLAIVFLITGAIAGLFQNFAPVPPLFKQLFMAACALVFLVWALGFVGLYGHWGYVRG